MPDFASLQQKPKNAQVKSPIFKNLIGGLNVRESITAIADNECAAGTNIIYYTAGAVVRRGGWQKLIANTPTANKLLGIYQAVFNISGALTYYLVITDGTDVWYTSNPSAASVTWNKITGSVTLDNANPYRFLMMNNIMVAYNGNKVFQWSGSGNIANMPNPGAGQIAVPTGRIGVVWQNYLFWGGGSTGGTYYPSRLFFSNLADPTTYPSANYVDVPTPNDGEQITGLAILYGNLVIFKRFSVYILQGTPPTNMVISKLNASIGCVDPNTVVQVDNLIYFVADKGLYAANLFNVRQVSYKVEPRYLAAIPVASAANPMWAANYRPRGHLFVAMNCKTLYAGGQTFNDRILAHDYFNADQNGDPAASEFIAGYTAYKLAAAKPANPTAPFVMGDYFYPGTAGNPSKNLTVMSSFYDAWVYVFTEGPLSSGGPADNINWMTSPTFPPTDFLSKFFDFGDPDMLKQIRWLWTTGQNYGSINLSAGVVYNDSPTATSFINANTSPITLASANNTLYQLTVDDDGAIDMLVTTDNTFQATLVLQDANGQNWSVGVDNDGAIKTDKTTSTAGTSPILASLAGFQWQISVDIDGALITTQVYAPSTATIKPGTRVVVTPSVNGVGGNKQGKYVQLYFVNIGILTQFSMDLIMKGRRN